MKILIIDSHKSGDDSEQQNLHWINGKIVSDYLNAKYIWSYPEVNDNIDSNYDRIIFNHASRYSYESQDWIYNSPNAKIFYICNDYNLGEAITLWKWAKTNSKTFEVIANHDKSSNINLTKCYVTQWHNVNLNALCFDIFKPKESFFDCDEKRNCIYYGTFRKRREQGFRTYLKDGIILSTHQSNYMEFRNIGCNSPTGSRIIWYPRGRGIYDFKYSLCLEDEITHTNYSRLPNRFYEALNYDVIPIFDIKSKNNVIKSGYNIPDYLFVDSYDNLLKTMKEVDTYDMSKYMEEWRDQAKFEKNEALETIKQIIL